MASTVRSPLLAQAAVVAVSGLLLSLVSALSATPASAATQPTIAPAAFSAPMVTPTSRPTTSRAIRHPNARNLAKNSSFQDGRRDWQATGKGKPRLRIVHPGFHSGNAIKLWNPTHRRTVLNDRPNTVRSNRAHDHYLASAEVRTYRPSVRIQLRVTELLHGRRVGMSYKTRVLRGDGWHKLAVHYRARRSGSVLDLKVIAPKLPGRRSFEVDRIRMLRTVTAPAASDPRTVTPPVQVPPNAHNGCTLSSILVPSCGVLWGAYLHPQTATEDWTTSQTDLEAQVGRRFDISYHYHDFSGPANANGAIPNDYEKSLAASGHIIFDDWGTQIFSTGKQLQWADIAAGDYDNSVIIPTAQSVKAYGQPIMISIDHEMDALVGSSGTAADYVAAYRHIVDVFAAQGVTNVIWVWTVESYQANWPIYQSLYPGNAYVDWIGYDPYNFAACHGTAWRSFSDTIDPFYQWLEQNGFGDKPFILPEYGTTSDPSDPTASVDWYDGVAAGLASHPNIKALVEWDDSTGPCNTYLTQDPGELKAFADAGMTPQVLGSSS